MGYSRAALAPWVHPPPGDTGTPGSLGLHDRAQHPHRFLYIPVDDTIIILDNPANFTPRISEAAAHDFPPLGPPAGQSARQFPQRRRRQKYRDRSRVKPLDLPGPLNVDVEKDIPTAMHTAVERPARGAVQVIMDLRPFGELPLGPHGVELPQRNEAVIATVDLAVAQRAGRA